MNAIRFALSCLKGRRARYVFCLILTVAMPLTVLINPSLQMKLVDVGVTGSANGGVPDHSVIVPTVVLMCLIMLGRTLLRYGAQTLGQSVSLGATFELRQKIFAKLQSMDMQFYHNNKTGDIITIMTSDVDMIAHNLVFVFRELIACVLLFVGATAYYFYMNWKMAIAMIALTPFLFIVSYLYRNKVRNIYKVLRERLSKLNSNAQENIEGNRVVKAFAREQYEMEKFSVKSDDFRKQNLKAQYLWLKFQPFIAGLSQSGMVTALLFGGIFLATGEITGGEYLAFTSLSWAVTAPFDLLGMLFNDLQRFFASAERIINLLNENPAVADTFFVPEGTPEARVTGDIEFRNVGFSFGANRVLSDISFSVKSGQSVAIMGETGSGKTLIANLISRFYDPTSGEVLIDGKNAKDWSVHDLRHSIGMTTQEVFLFSDTVDSNIAYGRPDLPEEDVREFAEVSAADFIEHLPQGYETIIGERGVGLSGGQKQRIALARALAIRPSILILDDTTSAVDMETEKFIQDRLRKLDFACTKVIIAQRISSVRHADNILFLEGGTIAESGTHDELLALRGRYYELWKIQTGALTEEVL